MSRIGKLPVKIEDKVKVEFREGSVFVQGPKGKLQAEVPEKVKVDVKDKEVEVSRLQDTKLGRTMQGLTRSLIYNMVKGVSEGYSRELEIQGVGFRAQVKGKSVELSLGFSHAVTYPLPEGITVKTPKPTNIVVEGIDKALVGQVAADIRRFYEPEPYKGKGVRYKDERVSRKQGKTVG